MSQAASLTEVLAGRAPAGVFRVRADALALIDASGWRLAVLGPGEAADKEQALQSLGPALGLPDYYGANLDALADCVADIREPTMLCWSGWESLADSDPRTFATICLILGEHGPAPDQGRAGLVVLLIDHSSGEPGSAPGSAVQWIE